MNGSTNHPPEPIDLTRDERMLLQALLKKHLPDITVWAYGSRVTGKAHFASDLDMVIFSGPEQAIAIAELREALEESNLPFRVDLFVWDQVPENFRKVILEKFVVIQ
ncbi:MULTISPECIES: nucleotidyltransferase family protein [unclassified Endozoicomonas]|uniref:nucleotidyltransferase family protein n=1 Tax=unclassified Endozoicomonas TaxID=2644528 RepID=UPI0021483FEB|nr:MULTISPECIES: nucleotidyltransferase domain-containing protein [unclassified Endozoicomonas]